MNKKKYWFLALDYRIWIPISWEGWGMTASFVCALVIILKVNGVSEEVAFNFSKHWPMLLELVISIVAWYWVSRGHVKKKH
jgi:hypothetical protein